MVSNIVASTLPKRLTTSAAPMLLSRLWTPAANRLWAPAANSLPTPAANTSGVAPGRQPLYLKHTVASSQRASPAARPRPPLEIPTPSSRVTRAYTRHIERIQAGRKTLEAQQSRSKTPISSQSRQLRPRPVKKTDSATVEQITEEPARTTASSSAPRQRPAPLFLNRQRSSSAPARLERKSFSTKRDVTQPSQALRRSKRVQFADEGFVVAEVWYFLKYESIDDSRRLQTRESARRIREYYGYHDDKTGRNFEVIEDQDQPIPRAPRYRKGYNPCCYRFAARGGFEMPDHYEYEYNRPVMPSPRCLEHAIVERRLKPTKVFITPDTSDMPSPPTRSTTSDNFTDVFGFTDVF